MKGWYKHFRSIIVLSLIISILANTLTGCTLLSRFRNSSSEQSETSFERSSEIQEVSSSDFSLEQFIYDLLYEKYAIVYDVFPATLTLVDGSKLSGFAFTDYSAYYEAEDCNVGYFTAGFIGDIGQAIPILESDKGLVITSLEYTAERFQYVYAYETDPFWNHCVVNNQYVKYGVGQDGCIVYEAEPYIEGSKSYEANSNLGSLYSYDKNRFIYDLNVGTFIPLTGKSLFQSIDYDAARDQINKLIESQNQNFSSIDIQTSVQLAQEAVSAYLLSQQESTLLGYPASSLAASVEAIDTNTFISFSPDGRYYVDLNQYDLSELSDIGHFLLNVCNFINNMVDIVIRHNFPEALPYVSDVQQISLQVFLQLLDEKEGVSDIPWNRLIVEVIALSVIIILPHISQLNFLSPAVIDMIIIATDMYLEEEGNGNGSIDVYLLSLKVGAAISVYENYICEFYDSLDALVPDFREAFDNTKVGQWLTDRTNELTAFIDDHPVHQSDSPEETYVSLMANKFADSQAEQ